MTNAMAMAMACYRGHWLLAMASGMAPSYGCGYGHGHDHHHGRPGASKLEVQALVDAVVVGQQEQGKSRVKVKVFF